MKNKKIIKLDRSIIPACDVSSIKEFEEIVSETCSVEGIGAYKIGFSLSLSYGLPKIVESAKKYTDLPIIYDHQKAGTDIPDVGKNFAEVCKSSGIDAVIIFPEAGPVTEVEWINAALKQGLGVIVGGEMTHPKYKRSEGGFIADDALDEMYGIAVKQGVKDFVVPGNRIDRIKVYKKLIEEQGTKPIFYSPGLIAQGGKISEAAKVAGDQWHAIVGRGIYKARDKYKASKELTREII